MTTPTLADVQGAIAAMDAQCAAPTGMDFSELQESLDEAANLAIAYCRSAGWRPIESAPVDGTSVIVSNGAAVGEARFWGGSGWFWEGSSPTDAHDGAVFHPTHWQPLPAPPRQPTADAGGMTHPPQGER